jgi:hypothetical protein
LVYDRNVRREQSGRRFSPGWVVVSYFMVLGGLSLALAGLAMSHQRSQAAALLACLAGAAVGGFYAGRASPHRAYLEPALAGVLVIASVVALVKSTVMGDLLLSLQRDAATRTAMILAGTTFVGAGLGTVLGELSQPRAPRLLPLRFVWISLLVTTGALLAAAITAAVLLLDQAGRQALADGLRGAPTGPLLDDSHLTLAAALVLAAASFAGGLVCQLAAPRRLLLPSASGAVLTVGGGMAALMVVSHEVDRLLLPAGLIAGTAWILALLGALVAFLAGRAAGRL